jgi:hypothetical protein
MDTFLISTLVVGTICVLPGVFALINLANKDKATQMAHVSHTTSRLSDEVWAIKDRMVDFSTENLWKRMYEKPVIIRCEHCKSLNVITSLECIKCGAPIGD